MNEKAKNSYTRQMEKKVSLKNSSDEWKVSYVIWAIKLLLTPPFEIWGC